MDEVVCEDKWYTLPLDAKLGLEVAQDVTKVYVEELTDKKGQPVNIMEPGKRTNGIWIIYTDKTNCLSNLSGAADHDVVTVAVSDAQDVGGYTVACT